MALATADIHAKAELPENLRITTREELEAFLDKRLAENEENGQYYTSEEMREMLSERLGVNITG